VRPEQTPLAGLAVLIVEDNLDSRDLVIEVVQYYGGLIVQADGIASALAQLELFLPDLIIADLFLTDGDGFELLARIRAHADPRVARVPVVAVTGRLEAAEQIFRAGFSAHLFKPINPDRLCAAIELFSSAGARRLRTAS
jgi:CheY-like chemotaxis protein